MHLPEYQSTPSGLPSDGPSVALLQTYSPWLLMHFAVIEPDSILKCLPYNGAEN